MPGEFHGQKSLVGYSSWGYKESDMTVWLTHTDVFRLKSGIYYLLPICSPVLCIFFFLLLLDWVIFMISFHKEISSPFWLIVYVHLFPEITLKFIAHFFFHVLESTFYHFIYIVWELYSTVVSFSAPGLGTIVIYFTLIVVLGYNSHCIFFLIQTVY